MMGQIKQDENMRQRARRERVIGTISSGIGYKMTGEREPPPSYHRHPRRFIKLTAHTMPLPVRRAEERNGETGNEGRSLTDKAIGTQNTATPHPPTREEQADEEDGGTGKQGEDEPDGIVEQIERGGDARAR